MLNCCFMSVITFGMETMTPTAKSVNLLSTRQRIVERAMQRIFLKEHIHNEDIKK